MKARAIFRSILVITFIVFTGTRTTNSCDTWIAMKNASTDGRIILVKNSDRTVFDSQPLMLYKRRSWPDNSKINLGRIIVPQVAETYAVIGSSPYWCWGFEEGMNEFGVAIGNEGIMTKSLQQEISRKQSGDIQPYGPTGMDILRLALERSKTALEAVQIIGAMTETYGQFGSGLPMVNLEGAYHNSYMVADPDEAWIVETTGRYWVARRITEDVTSISNTFSISDTWDLASEGLIENAIKSGWWDDSSADFDFASAYSNDQPVYVASRQRANIRANCSQGLLQQKSPQIDVDWMMRIARDRSTTPSLDLDVTASSCIVAMPKSVDELAVFWWAPSVPGISCYVPYFVQSGELPPMVSEAGSLGKSVTPPREVAMDQFTEDSFWWLFRDLADLTNLDWDNRREIVRARFDILEKEFIDEVSLVSQQAAKMINKGLEDEASSMLARYTEQCYDKVLVTLHEFRVQFEQDTPEIDPQKFKDFEGIYEVRDGLNFAITVKGEQVFAQFGQQPSIEIFPVFKDRFEYHVVKASIQFERNVENDVTGLMLFQGGQEIPARRISVDRPGN